MLCTRPAAGLHSNAGRPVVGAAGDSFSCTRKVVQGGLQQGPSERYLMLGGPGCTHYQHNSGPSTALNAGEGRPLPALGTAAHLLGLAQAGLLRQGLGLTPWGSRLGALPKAEGRLVWLGVCFCVTCWQLRLVLRACLLQTRVGQKFAQVSHDIAFTNPATGCRQCYTLLSRRQCKKRSCMVAS